MAVAVVIVPPDVLLMLVAGDGTDARTGRAPDDGSLEASAEERPDDGTTRPANQRALASADPVAVISVVIAAAAIVASVVVAAVPIIMAPVIVTTAAAFIGTSREIAMLMPMLGTS